MDKFTLKDFRVAMVLTTKDGSKYVVVADDNGHHDVIRLNGDKPGNSNGLEINNAGFLAVCGGKNGDNGREIIKIEEFDAVPTRNRLSEALKFITGRPFTEKLVTVWEREDEQVAELRKEAERLAHLAEIARKNYEAACADEEEEYFF